MPLRDDSQAEHGSLQRMLGLLRRLADAQIYYTLERNRDDAICVNIVVPGERWEVDFYADGMIETERFVSSGDLGDESWLEELFARFSDPGK